MAQAKENVFIFFNFSYSLCIFFYIEEKKKLLEVQSFLQKKKAHTLEILIIKNKPKTPHSITTLSLPFRKQNKS